MTVRETPQHLLDELREVLGPMLCGLSDDDPTEALAFAGGQLKEYLIRCAEVRSGWPADVFVMIYEEADDGDDTEP